MADNGVTIYEFGVMIAARRGCASIVGLQAIPEHVFAWLEKQCLRVSESHVAPWVRLVQRDGQRAVQVTSFVGVIRAPDGFQIEVLPKVGKAINGGDNEARAMLIEMLRCLGEFRHIQTASARLSATAMPLLEIFISDFLSKVSDLVRHGLRGDYTVRQENVFALRGKLLMSQHLRQNLCRADRFFSEFDFFSVDRPENRLLRTAVKEVLRCSRTQVNQRLARELNFVFADIPESVNVDLDFQRIRLDRGMTHYGDALAWARLILEKQSPLTGAGEHFAPSLLFPMEALFEAYVAKHLRRQLSDSYILKMQTASLSLVRHKSQSWFRLKPDLQVLQASDTRLILDTKWKLLDEGKGNSTSKYGLAQSDFYQLQAYGQNYLDGTGDVILIYPKTEKFRKALPVFEFPKAHGLRLWVLPFCLEHRSLILPTQGQLSDAAFEPSCVHPH